MDRWAESVCPLKESGQGREQQNGSAACLSVFLAKVFNREGKAR